MIRGLRQLLGSAVGVVLVGAAVAAVPAPAGAAQPASHPNHGEHAVCARAHILQVSCHIHVLDVGDGVTSDASPSPTGLAPATIKAVYNFPTSATAGAGQTVAIVDAYDDPTAASDLAKFSTQYGLPCNNCLTKVSETGSTNLPPVDPSWALEISLDVQWAHAVAPGANILLVEARSTSLSDLGVAEQYATQHANYVSNSWGGPEFSYEKTYDSYFAKAGVSVFVASGDSGLGAEYPSASPNVISVGGTQLNAIGTAAFAESAWSGGGGGCSAYESAVTAQSGFTKYAQVGCNGSRATPDVALDASPASGVSVYDSTLYNGQTGWFTVGGTSASAPMWAGRAAVEAAVVNAGYVYGSSIPFRDITSGGNGAPCLSGFNLCAGRGSWLVPAPLPGAPTLNSATGGVGSVGLSWSAPTSGGTPTSYDVYRQGSAGPITQVATGVAGTTYTDTVSAGTYTYQVSAVNGTGQEGPLSNSLQATATAPANPPGPPTLTNATGGTSVSLTWSAPTTGGAATSYNVYRGTTSGGETILQSGVTSTSYTDGPSAGTYFYKITAVDSSGEGPFSNEMAASVSAPPPQVPGAPILNSATGGSSITLAWSAPTSGGSATSYDVYRGTAAGGETLLATGITTLGYTDSPAPGTYFYKVSAVNGTGQGALSNERSATVNAPPPAVPGAPTLTSATGGSSVSLSWSAPTTGGAPSTYNVYRGTSSGTETLLRSGVVGTSVTDSPTAGTYFYEITAVNGTGEGARSNERSATVSTGSDELPTASFGRSCTYSACTFTSTSSDPDGTITSYAWSGGNGLTGSSNRVTHGYTAAGTYAVNLTVVDSSGQQGTVNSSVTCALDAYHRVVCQ